MARDPNQVYSFDGKLYGAGQKLSSADLDKENPVRERKSESAPTVNETPLETGSVSKSGAVKAHESSATTASGQTEEDLEEMSLSELRDLADERGTAVKGTKKADYVKALAG